MTGELRYVTFNTDMGWVGILGSAKGLLCITLPQRSAQEARQLLGGSVNDATWAPHLFDDIIQRFGLYFSGHRVTFPDELDFSGATPFQHQVWEETRLISYGETRSYAWVARGRLVNRRQLGGWGRLWAVTHYRLSYPATG